MGLIMEILMNISDDKVKQMYQYHKLGCPIAWITGWLNKFSLFKIKINNETCKKCGICDKQCYIVAMEPVKYSLYKQDMQKPGNSYTCSKCLKCVTTCPNGSLQYKI
jgi:polyferredoxin